MIYLNKDFVNSLTNAEFKINKNYPAIILL